jgi:thioester reductase-like protein
MGQRTILFTGFPGFIGARLIPRLLADDPQARLVALVEPRMESRAREVAAGLPDADRIAIQAGDITQPQLGLDAATHDALTRDVVAVYHLAAVYDLAVGAGLAERVNVTGTSNVVAFTRACENLERHHYVSTAYVAGTRSGVVMEDDLTAGQDYKNHYESTKFAAEVLVRAAMDEVPTTIYRPAIVVGDSRTGETQKFDGPSYMLRTVSALFGPLPRLGSEEATFNVVPVDFVVDAIAAGAGDPQAAGKTLHLVDPEPLSSAEVYALLAHEYAGKVPRLRIPLRLVERSMKRRTVRRLLGGTPRETLIYLNHPVRFDTTNATEVLGRAGMRCPRFPEYVGAMVSFFRAHEDDPALRPAHET